MRLYASSLLHSLMDKLCVILVRARKSCRGGIRSHLFQFISISRYSSLNTDILSCASWKMYSRILKSLPTLHIRGRTICRYYLDHIFVKITQHLYFIKVTEITKFLYSSRRYTFAGDDEPLRIKRLIR